MPRSSQLVSGYAKRRYPSLNLHPVAMAAHLFSPPPSISTSTSTSSLTSPPPTPLLRCHNANGVGKRSGFRRRSALVLSCSAKPTSGIGLQRRELLLFALSSTSLVFPSQGLLALSELGEDVKMEMFTDDINAYSYMYPTSLPSKKFAFKWIVSRQPEKYSSAAPLSPDARLRIVSERVDMINNAVISISIGPPNSSFITSNDKTTWSAQDVADSVLSDKSSLRVTTSQRMQESSVLDAYASEIDGEPYWYYEYVVRKSPTKLAPESNLYRHFVASTAERDGYLYSLNASTLSKQWEFIGPFLKQAVASFHLQPPTENYIPPYKDPWRFW